MPSDELLVDLFLYLVFGGGAGVAVYWLLDRPFMKKLTGNIALWTDFHLGVNKSQLVRVVAGGLCILLSVGLYVLGGVLLPMAFNLPVNVVGWMNLILYLGGLSYGSSQAVHLRDLGKQKR